MAERVDVVVLGMGVAGESVGGKLAASGLSVVGIEAGLVGGECPYWGCIPSKLMVRAAHVLAEARRVNQLAGIAEPQPDWRKVADRIREQTADWDDTAAVARFQEAGGQFIRGRGRLAGPGRVVVNGDREFEATRAVVVASGTRPVVPSIDGLADTPYWTNREAVEVTELPESLLVIGGGAVGMELAQVFARYGVTVTVFEAQDRLVPEEEPESSSLLAEVLADDGLTVHTSAQVTRVSHDRDGFRLEWGDGQVARGQRLMLAAGRRADLTELGVDSVGIDPSAPALPVDDRMRAGERLWAVGDVTGKGMFTHVGTQQALIAVRDILDKPGPPADYRALPRVTFTDPEIGAVGMTEAQARAAGLRVAVGYRALPDTSRGRLHGVDNRGFLKLVADTDRGVLVGATSAGPAGGEVMSGLAVAVAAEVPLATLRHMIYAFPTFHRGILEALRAMD